MLFRNLKNNSASLGKLWPSRIPLLQSMVWRSCGGLGAGWRAEPCHSGGGGVLLLHSRTKFSVTPSSGHRAGPRCLVFAKRSGKTGAGKATLAYYRSLVHTWLD